MDTQNKANGLHSGTKIWEKLEGQHTIQYHEHPETHELVVLNTWYEQNGEDDVSSEFEVMGVYEKEACEDLKDRIKDLNYERQELKKCEKRVKDSEVLLENERVTIAKVATDLDIKDIDITSLKNFKWKKIL